MRRLFVCISLLTIAVTLEACGGVVSPKPEFTPAVVQGQYEIVASSTVNPGAVALVEVNFTQADDQVFAGKPSVLIIQGTQPAGLPLTLTSFGPGCDNGVIGNDSVQGTFSSATELPFTWTENGVLGNGTSTGDVIVSSDGSKIVSGTYTNPAQCGFGADNGNLTGAAVKPFSGQYSGRLANTSGTLDAVTIIVTQNGFNLTVAGTDNGTAFTLTGTVIGATFDVSGSIGGTSVRYIGRYHAIGDAFVVYDPTLATLGYLGGGT